MKDEEILLPIESEPASADSDEANAVQQSSDSEEYYSLPSTGSRNIIWSVASLVLAILSIALCAVYVPAMIIAVCAAAAAVVFRLHFGYFNKPAVGGLILAIFGLVFSVCSMIVDIIGLFG